ncbi:MAG TPA: PhoU domain-containing protein [Actinomycetes bacterium]|nr:PhoU domain-containing protein [Actinomycetes bacterium]
MRVTFQQRVAELEARLLDLGGRVCALLGPAIGTLRSGDEGVAATIGDGHRAVQATSAAIHWDLLRTVALEQPVAGDLRLLAGLLHIDTHLERMAGLATNLARAAVRMDRAGPPDEPRELLLDMGGHAERLARTALDALDRRDLDLARSLPDLDRAVDLLNDRLLEQLGQLTGTGAMLAWAIQAVLAGRFLERLGDHAVDIAEQVAFVLTGEVREFLPPKAARGAPGG